MIATVCAVLAGCGVHLVYGELALGRRGFRTRLSATPRSRRVAGEWMAQAGLADVRPVEFVGVVVAVFALGATLAFAVFGGLAAALAVGAFAASFPLVSARARRMARRSAAQDAWPRMLEEIRVQTNALGRSIPQALFEVGRRGPDEMRSAFEAAYREWLISTDFERTLRVLKARLADPTADATCETLLIAHELGGSDLDRRLEALIEDRILDTQGRKDARAKQAGVRFARRFVLLVPLGMAVAGMSVGTGRSAYQSAEGQLLVVIGIAMVIACWAWAGRLMKLPEEERVFFE